METRLQQRCSSRIGATQIQPREARLVVHYGPFHEIVAEQHSLFKVAGELLTRVTPWLRYVQPMEADGVMHLPDVELPHDVVQGFFATDDDEEDESRSDGRNGQSGQGGATSASKGCASSVSQKFSRRALGTSTAAADSLAHINRRGRPVLTLTSAALGELQVASWTQWESVQEMLLQEERNKYRTHYYQLSAGQPPSSSLLVHAELTILWFEVDTLHCLHYDDLVHAYARELSPDEEEEEGVEDDQESDADAEVDLPLVFEGNTQGVRAPLPPSAPHPDRDRRSDYGIVDEPGQPEEGRSDERMHTAARIDKAAAAAVRASMNTPSLIARLYVVDVDGNHRGQVLLPLALDPPVTLTELEGLVRATAGSRSLHHAIRLSYRVLPPSSLVLSTSNSPSRPEAARAGGLSTPRELAVSVTSTMSHYSQQPGVLSRSILKPLSAEEDVNGLIDDVLLYGYRAIRLVLVATDRTNPIPPSPRAPHDYLVDVAPSASGRGPTVDVDAVNGAGSRHPSDDAYPAMTKRDVNTEAQEANKEEGDDTSQQKDEDDDDALVVVRYTVDPVEVHITGEVDEDQLVWLADAIYTRCCRPDNYKPREGGARSGSALSERNRLRPRFLRTRDGPRSAPTKGGSSVHASGSTEPAHWVLPLHDYDFSEADEDVMGLCIQEAMMHGGRMTAMDPEEIQDLVDDLEREFEDGKC